MSDGEEDIDEFLHKLQSFITQGQEQLDKAEELFNNLGATGTELGGGVIVKLDASGDINSIHIDEYAYKKGPDRLSTAIKSAFSKARTILQTQTHDILSDLIGGQEADRITEKYFPTTSTATHEEFLTANSFAQPSPLTRPDYIDEHDDIYDDPFD